MAEQRRAAPRVKREHFAWATAMVAGPTRLWQSSRPLPAKILLTLPALVLLVVGICAGLAALALVVAAAIFVYPIVTVGGHVLELLSNGWERGGLLVVLAGIGGAFAGWAVAGGSCKVNTTFGPVDLNCSFEDKFIFAFFGFLLFAAVAGYLVRRARRLRAKAPRSEGLVDHEPEQEGQCSDA